MAQNIIKNLYGMLRQNDMTDVTFVVKGVEIRGHRVVVSHMGGPLRELVQSENTKRVVIKDITPNTFWTLLQFLYTDKCTVTQQNYFELLYVAKIFKLDALKIHCFAMNVVKVTENNVCAFATQALHFEAHHLWQKCVTFFDENTYKVLQTQEFLDIPGNLLEMFCSHDQIHCTECQIFVACVKWANIQCRRQKLANTPENLRKVLKDILPLIRFPCIPEAEFMSTVVPTKILTDLDVGQIIVGMKTAENRTEYFSTYRTTVEVKLAMPPERDFKGDIIVERPVKTISHLPLSTTILELKNLLGICRWLTISELRDSDTLASVYKYGLKLNLRVTKE